MRKTTADSVAEDIALILRYQASSSSSNRFEEETLERAILQRYRSLCQYFVHAVASRATTWTILTPDDLLNEAQLAVLQTAKRYSPDQGANFQTYATQRIKGAILDLMRNSETHIHEQPRCVSEIATSWMRHVDAAAGNADKGSHTLRTEFITAMMEERPNLSRTYIEDALDAAERSDVAISNVEDMEHNLHVMSEATLVADASSDPARAVERQQNNAHAMSFIVAEIEKLDPRSAAVLLERLYGTASYLEMAEVLGVSEARVCQLSLSAITKLNKAFLTAAERLPGGLEISCDDLAFVPASNQTFEDCLQALTLKR